MNKLVWKLLRQHISIGQLSGFFLANIFGMLIVLLSVQFYKDVLPVFTQGDSFMKKDYIIATKKISTLGSITGQSNTFSKDEIKELEAQPFTRSVGAFTPTLFKVSAGLGSVFLRICFLNLFPMLLSMSAWTSGTLMKVHKPYLSSFPAII